MALFNEINAQRKAASLPELIWSDDLYNSTTLLHAKIFHTDITVMVLFIVVNLMVQWYL